MEMLKDELEAMWGEEMCCLADSFSDMKWKHLKKMKRLVQFCLLPKLF